MKKNFFSSIFKKTDKKNKLFITDSLLVKKLKSVSIDNNFKILEKITIFHHSKKINIPLIVINPKRGIYIFEHKDWTYDDLSKYEIQKSQNNERSHDTLAYDKVNTFINMKFNEILHNDCIKVFNYLLAENLSFVDYEHLSEEKKSLLPDEKIIFSDTDNINILKKLNEASDIDTTLPNIDFIMANLLTQYLVLNNGAVSYATQEQISYISHLFSDKDDTKFKEIISINGLAYSGKTTTLILKAIFLKLSSDKNSVTIIEPTTLSCDIVKQSILELIEYSIVNIDVTSINVYTPEEFLNSKLSSYVLCDDSFLVENNILQKIISKSKKSNLTLVNPIDRYQNYYKLTKRFHEKAEIEFLNDKSYKTSLKLIKKYSKENSSKSILSISSQQNKENLMKDAESLDSSDIVIRDGSKNLIDQSEGHITISDYKNMNTLRNDIVILQDVCDITQEELSYAINLANNKIYIIYEQECQSILTLKKIFNKE